MTTPHKVVDGIEVPLAPAEIAEIETRAAADAAAAPILALAGLRSERNRRLAACDWTQMSDTPLSPVVRTGWAAYRQALRDFPETVTDPLNPPPWPVAPA